MGKTMKKMGGAYFNLRWKPRRKRNLALFFVWFCFFDILFLSKCLEQLFLLLFLISCFQLFFFLSSVHQTTFSFLSSQRFQSTRFSMCPIPITTKIKSNQNQIFLLFSYLCGIPENNRQIKSTLLQPLFGKCAAQSEFYLKYANCNWKQNGHMLA